ncbi:MAG: DMT family transporter [Chloroflexota bacterium]
MSAKRISVALLATTALLWSTLGIYIRLLADDFAILQQVYLRIAFAALFVGVIGVRQIRWYLLAQWHLNDWLLIVVRAAFLYLLGVSMTSVAFINGQYTTISLIKALPMTAVLGFLIFNERVTSKKLFYVSLSFIGAALLVVPDIVEVLSRSPDGEPDATNFGFTTFGYGELMGFLSIICFAFSHGARKWQRADINSWESTFFMFCATVPMMIIASWAAGDAPLVLQNLTSTTVLFALTASALINAIGLIIINYALGHLEIALFNNIIALQPAFGVVVGVLVYQDVITIWEGIGGLVIVASIIGMNRIQTYATDEENRDDK